MSILTLRPNSCSVYGQDRNGSTGGTNNWDTIDEVTLSSTDYNMLNRTSQTSYILDIYGFPNHTGETGTIQSVTLKGYFRIVTAGTVATNAKMKFAVKIGSTTYYGAEQDITSTSDTLLSEQWSNNPNTVTSWTWTNIDDLLAGDALINALTDTKNYKSPVCDQLWVEVDYTAGGGSLLLPRRNFKHMIVR